MSKKISFSRWKERVVEYAEKYLCTGDLFDDSDPYSIKEAFDPQHAYDSGQSPSTYVREVFAEDFAGMANDRQLARGR